MLALRQAHPRRQGDIGEAAAIAWLTRTGFGVWVPLGHSADADLIAEREDRLLRVQVKTSTALRNGRYEVSLATKGGNRSWSGRVKTIDPSRYEFLFVLVGDGRQWFIPAAEIAAKTMVLLGGPKYAAFEVGQPQPA
jgi:PD-(D/E)XK endonuclease